MRVLPVLALALIGVIGCGAVSGEHACTLLAARSGIGVELSAGIVEEVAGVVELVACWNGTCRSREVRLKSGTVPMGEDCANGACSARMKPTGRAWAFASFPRLPADSVRVTLTLRGESGEPVVEETLHVNPETSYPNGRRCPGSGNQVQLVVDASGDVRVRE